MQRGADAAWGGQSVSNEGNICAIVDVRSHDGSFVWQRICYD
eukprot:COSAG03_NODE_28754_length_194_cov_44.536842_1_plen_41_part_10